MTVMRSSTNWPCTVCSLPAYAMALKAPVVARVRVGYVYVAVDWIDYHIEQGGADPCIKTIRPRNLDRRIRQRINDKDVLVRKPKPYEMIPAPFLFIDPMGALVFYDQPSAGLWRPAPLCSARSDPGELSRLHATAVRQALR